MESVNTIPLKTLSLKTLSLKTLSQVYIFIYLIYLFKKINYTWINPNSCTPDWYSLTEKIKTDITLLSSNHIGTYSVITLSKQTTSVYSNYELCTRAEMTHSLMAIETGNVECQRYHLSFTASFTVIRQWVSNYNLLHQIHASYSLTC